MRIVFYCPTEIKEIKEILLPARCEALSAISAISVGHYYPMRIVFISRRNKGNQGNLYSALREALSVISVISVGLLLYHADSILLSHGNKGNSRNYSYLPPRSSFCPFCGTIIISCG